METLPDHLQQHFDISFLSTFRTKAVARYYYDMTTREDIMRLPEIYAFAKEKNLPITIIGGGTNCLFAFDHYDGIIVRNRYVGYSEPYAEDGKKLIQVHSGELSTTLAIKLYQSFGISTLIPWVGLPGTMGGACIGNAGCFGLEMSELLVSAHVLDLESGEVSVYENLDMLYHYRESALKGDRKTFIIDMILDVSPKGGDYETYTPANLQSLRKTKQPPGFTCGSFFKNPEGSSAGKIIDEAGLKGTRVGGVHVSEQHGNFFINDQQGNWKNILKLRDIIEEKVLEKYGIELHEEVQIITNV